MYVGVTGNLELRMWQHKTKYHPKSFTARYNIDQLMYYEEFENPIDAIAREKQLKAGPVRKKIELITKNNPAWVDLSSGWNLD